MGMDAGKPMNMMKQNFDQDRADIELDALKEARDLAREDASGGDQIEPTSLLDRIGWFRNLSLRGKVNSIFGAFFAVGLSMMLVLSLGLGELWLRYNTTERVNDAVYEAVELRSVAGDLRYDSALFLFIQEDQVLETQRAGYDQARTRIDTIESIANETSPNLLPNVERARSQLSAYNAAFTTVITAQSQGADDARLTTLGERLAARGEELIAGTRQLADDFDAEREGAQRAGIAYFSNMIMVLAILAAIATIILFVGLRYLSHNFSSKIEEVTDQMSRLARGDKDFEISDGHRQDEIGAMARALATFRRASEQYEAWAKERSERAEETIRLQEERERERKETEEHKAKLLEEVAWQFERTVGEVVEKVASASAELGNTATNMAATAEQASERTSDLAQNMEEANVGATAAAAASDEFALSIGEISRQATSSSELARLANNATVEADTTISTLASSADQIGQIVELIQTIAQRTNLLALNASIEAARGGEAGRGFAVVASEVKELAMQTSRATDEVAEQIKAMQDSTGASVSALRAIASQVMDLESTATAIATAVDQQSIAGQDLARNIDLAARGTDQVAINIKDVRALSLSTGAAANQVRTSAGDLETQATTLSEQVKTFLQRVRAA